VLHSIPGVPRRTALLSAMVVLVSITSGAQAPSLLTTAGPFDERRETLRLDSGATVSLRVLLQPDHAAHASRIVDAARVSLNQYSEWFSPYPYDRLTIVDQKFQVPFPDQLEAATVAIRARWLEPERSMRLDAQVARGIATLWWGNAILVQDQFLADGLAEYAQSRIVERLFDERHRRVNYSLAEIRVFGGLAPWAVRALRLDRQTTGISRAEFRKEPALDLRERDPRQRAARAGKTAAALVTLERYLGWPALQRGLSAAAKTYAGKPMPAAAFASTVGAAADRDLAWFFDQAFSSRAVYDYAIDGVTSSLERDSKCGASSCYRSTVVLGRHGAATFTGTSKPSIGEYESGRALTVEVTFADGEKMIEYWDGRATSRTLEFQSPSALVSARIDPARTLMLDLYAINNVVVLTPPPGRPPSLPWAARWTIWLQDAMQTASFFF
jgi:hypothetical protein